MLSTLRLDPHTACENMVLKLRELGGLNNFRHSPTALEFIRNIQTGNKKMFLGANNPSNMRSIVLPIYFSCRLDRNFKPDQIFVRGLFGKQLKEHPEFEDFANALSLRSGLERLPFDRNLFPMDLVWSDWAAEAICIILKRDLDNGVIIPSFKSFFSAVHYAAQCNESRQFLLYSVSVDPAFFSKLAKLYGMFIQPTGKGVPRYVEEHEKNEGFMSVFRDMEATRKNYLKNAVRMSKENDRFVKSLADYEKAGTKAERQAGPTTTKVELEAKVETKKSTKCPRPGKQSHRSMTSARRAIEDKYSGDLFIEPYKCVCGSIHIGHPIKDKTRSKRLKVNRTHRG